MNFESDDHNYRRSQMPDLGPQRRQNHGRIPEVVPIDGRQNEQNHVNQDVNNAANNEGGFMPVLTGILPLPIEGIDERDIYTRFTSSELARYTINLLKERIHLLRLIFTMFVLVFTNLTNLLILLPSKHRHEFTFWEVTLNYIIYVTPVVQLNWFVLLIFGKNNSNYYYSLKMSIIGLTSVTSIIAYFGVLEDDIFQMCDSHIVFFICMANISATLLC